MGVFIINKLIKDIVKSYFFGDIEDKIIDQNVNDYIVNNLGGNKKELWQILDNRVILHEIIEVSVIEILKIKYRSIQFRKLKVINKNIIIDSEESIRKMLRSKLSFMDVVNDIILGFEKEVSRFKNKKEIAVNNFCLLLKENGRRKVFFDIFVNKKRFWMFNFKQ